MANMNEYQIIIPLNVNIIVILIDNITQLILYL